MKHIKKPRILGFYKKYDRTKSLKALIAQFANFRLAADMHAHMRFAPRHQ